MASWPIPILVIVGVLAYVTLTHILRLLATITRHEIAKHEVVREAHNMRKQYLEQLKRARANPDGSAEIIED